MRRSGAGRDVALHLLAVVMVGALLYVAINGFDPPSPSSPSVPSSDMPAPQQMPVQDSLCEGSDFVHYDDCRQW